MVGAFFGHVWTRPSTVAVTLPDQRTEIEIESLAYRAESFRSPPYYGYRIGWIPDAHSWLSIEAEFIHAKVFAETGGTARIRGMLRGALVDAPLPVSPIVQRLAMSHGLNFILANLALRRDIGADSWGPHRLVAVVRVGAGPTLPHAESTVEGLALEQYEAGGLSAQAAGGLEVTLWRRLTALGEYKFTWATPRIDVARGHATLPARSHHLAAGLGYRF